MPDRDAEPDDTNHGTSLASMFRSPEDVDADQGQVRTAVAAQAYLINLTGGRLEVRGEGRSVVLAPLRRLPLSAVQLSSFDEAVLVDSDLVRLERLEVPAAHAPIAAYAFLVVLGGTCLSVGLVSGHATVGLVALGACVLIGVLLWGAWTLVSATEGRPPTARRSSRWLGEKAAQVLVFLIGFGSALAAAVVANRDGGGLGEADQEALFRIVLQTLFLGLAITFPAFLYFAFDRQRAAALRTRFLADAIRLDERLNTVGEIEAMYGARMKDAFGDAGSRLPSEDRVRSGRRRSPVVVATLVLSLALVVAFVDVNAGAASQEGPLLGLFTPTSAILPFAFLGAYLFAVLTSLRSYLRGDLLPKAYSQIAARMLVVVTLAAVMGALSDAITSPGPVESVVERVDYQAWLLALAFFAGLVPNTVLQFFSESMRRVFRRFRAAPVFEPQPLSMLQGIDLYDRARLEQEGVTTLGGLVHGDLIDLMIQTRIPTGRLVDWLDQAVLLIHMAQAPSEEEDDAARPACTAWSAAVRARGFRTACELVDSPSLEPPLQELARLVDKEPAMRRVRSWRACQRIPDRILDARPTSVPARDGPAAGPATEIPATQAAATQGAATVLHAPEGADTVLTLPSPPLAGSGEPGNGGAGNGPTAGTRPRAGPRLPSGAGAPSQP
jgi:hypothetical protein